MSNQKNKHIAPITAILGTTLLVMAFTMIIASSDVAADQQHDDIQIWQSFRDALQSGKMADPARYRPLYPILLQPLMGYLEEMRKTVKWEDGGPQPEIFHVGNRIHYVIPLQHSSMVTRRILEHTASAWLWKGASGISSI